MKKFLIIFSAFIGLTLLLSVFLAFNTGYLNKYSKIQGINTSQAVVFIKKDIIAKNWTNIVKIQKDLSSKISSNMKKTRSEKFLLYFLISLGLAFIYGIIHSLGPGHGKMVVMSYFLSEKAKLKEAPLMALQVSGTHIASAIILVFLVNVSLRQVLTDSVDKVYWIKVISYSLVILTGFVLLFKKIFERSIKEKMLNLNRGVLSVAAGMIPCTGALLILLFAMANNMIIKGIFLVFAIGLGIATTLSAVGITTMLTKKVITRETIFTKGKNIAVALEYLGVFTIISLGIIMLTLTIAQ